MYCPTPLTLPQPPSYMNRGAAGRGAALWEVCPFMLAGLGEAHQPSSTQQQKMPGLSQPKGLRYWPPPAAFWGSGHPHLFSRRSSTCLVVAKAR